MTCLDQFFRHTQARGADLWAQVFLKSEPGGLDGVTAPEVRRHSSGMRR